jgi:site-specific DNA recombinase
MRRRGAIYARISRVEAKKGLVENNQLQIGENSDYADLHNVEVVSVLQDNLTASRFTKKDRPDFQRLLAAIQAGLVDVVLVTEQSRLDRQLWNILELIELARTTPFRQIIATRSDDVLDLSTESGINRAIDQANRDRHEAELISQRTRFKKRARAREGLYDGGQRPYGYEADGITVRESEAAIIRECRSKILAGQSVLSIVRELNERKVPSATGGRWHVSSLQKIFESMRIIGVRTHHGVEYRASWPAIVAREEWERIQVILRSRSATWAGRSRARSYLLTGFVVCGNCDAKMVGHGHANPAGGFYQRYYCKKENNSGQITGCGKVGRMSEPLDALVTEALLYRLDTQELAQALGKATESAGMAQALVEYQQAKGSLRELLADYYRERNQYARAEMLKLKARLEEDLEAITKRMEKLDARHSLLQFPFGDNIRAVWESADLELKRSLLGLVIEKVVVLPGRSGSKRWRDEQTGREYYFDPDRIRIVWRV